MSNSYIPPEAGTSGLSYSVNVETLTGNKTILVGTDATHHHLNPNGVNRAITVDETGAIEGSVVYIKNTGVSTSNVVLTISVDSATRQVLYPGASCMYIYNSETSSWYAADSTSPDTGDNRYNIAIGYNAGAYNQTVAIGYQANTGTAVTGSYSVCIGYNSLARGNYNVVLGNTATTDATYAVSVGYSSSVTGQDSVAIGKSSVCSAGFAVAVGSGATASGANSSMAIGTGAQATDLGAFAIGRGCVSSFRHAIAMGYQVATTRVGEIATRVGTNTKHNMFKIQWGGQTANATPLEIYTAAGYSSNGRLTIKASSILSGKIIIAARDNTTGDCAVWHKSVSIKRDAANNTALVGAVQDDLTTKEDASWDVAVTADDTNEALVVTVTGDATNTVSWTAMFDGVEVTF